MSFLKKNEISHDIVSQLFSSIAIHYDKANNLMSFGLHHRWKRFFVDQFPWNDLKNPIVYVDMGCGSADIGKYAISKALQKNKILLPIFIDPNQDMMNQGKQKIINKQVKWLCAWAESIPLPSHSVDLYSIAFSLRNATDRNLAIQEAYRILKTGGHFFCLEFSLPTSWFMKKAYKIYSKILPILGAIATGRIKPYIYLKKSIANFPQPLEIIQELKATGFHKTEYRYLCAGIVAIVRGEKP
jgi:demethylmenaquinone methyltransferase/2-methoxy-6-polyprenyl-1,4-benzoquinol methylase